MLMVDGSLSNWKLHITLRTVAPGVEINIIIIIIITTTTHFERIWTIFKRRNR